MYGLESSSEGEEIEEIEEIEDIESTNDLEKEMSQVALKQCDKEILKDEERRRILSEIDNLLDD